MLEFDRYMLARTETLKAEVRKAYEAFDFQAVYHAVLNFAVIDLSSLFIDVARDRLYCGGANSRERRSAQTALYNVLDALVRILARTDSVHRRRGLLKYAGREGVRACIC